MKPYALFMGSSYYPSGGAGDFISFGDSIEDLKKLADAKFEDIHSCGDWADIVKINFASNSLDSVLWGSREYFVTTWSESK